MSAKFDQIIASLYQESDTVDRKISDVLAVSRIPNEAVPEVLYLADFVASVPGLEMWASTPESLNKELEDLFEPWAFPELAWRCAVAYGSEFNIFKSRMLGQGEMLSIELQPNYVPFSVENGELVNAILATIAFNEVWLTHGFEHLESYEDDHLAALGLFGGWRDLAYTCVAECAHWGFVPISLSHILRGSHANYHLGDLAKNPWLANPESVWNVLKGVKLFSGSIDAAKLQFDSAVGLCVSGGKFELGEQVLKAFNA
jgi:hypothetical protein